MNDTYRQASIRNIKLAAICVGLLIVLIIIIEIFIGYLSTAKLTVISSPTNTITITRLNVNSSTAYIKQAAGRISVNLHSGMYNITVTNKTFASQHIVDLVAHHNQTIKIYLNSVGVVEPVSTRAAGDLAVSSSSMTFLDRSNDDLFYVDSSDNEHLLESQDQLASVEWANPNYGVAQDQSGNLYLVDNNVVTKLELPYRANLNDYALTPNQELYLSDGINLYEGTVGGSFNKIYSGKGVDISSASNSGILLVGEDEDGISSGKSGQLRVISSSGQDYVLSGETYQSAWSPNGDYIVSSSDSGTAIYTNKLKLIANLPSSNVTSPTWLDNNTLFYGIDGGLWSYSMATKSANLVASVSLFGYVSEITPDLRDGYIYVLIQNTQTQSIGFQLARFGLDDQSVSSLMLQLQVFLPNTVSGCYIGYTNLTQPVINIQGVETSPQSCRSIAQTYLQNYGINTAGLTFSVDN